MSQRLKIAIYQNCQCSNYFLRSFQALLKLGTVSACHAKNIQLDRAFHNLPAQSFQTRKEYYAFPFVCGGTMLSFSGIGTTRSRGLPKCGVDKMRQNLILSYCMHMLKIMHQHMQLIYSNQIFISDIEDWRDSAERRMYSLHPSQAAHNYLQLQIQGT